MLIVHEVMGRNCGWLTAATARAYREWRHPRMAARVGWKLSAPLGRARRLRARAAVRHRRGGQAPEDDDGQEDCVNLFISEGAGVDEIVAEMEAAGEEVPRDPFGHVQLDKVNPGEWFASKFAAELGAAKVMVQKSGYFSRSAAANEADLALIRAMTNYAVDAALRGESGVIGQDEERDGELRVIEFERIKGGKAFDTAVPWFTDLMRDLGQA